MTFPSKIISKNVISKAPVRGETPVNSKSFFVIDWLEISPEVVVLLSQNLKNHYGFQLTENKDDLSSTQIDLDLKLPNASWSNKDNLFFQ